MCGICGILRFDGLGLDTGQLIKKMTDKLVHRGPDSFGYHSDAHCAFGFRRLSIIDLNTGDQPIGNEDGTIWIVFNGEIYNFQDLRTRLLDAGHHFCTNTDTEVILHAYEEFGVECLKLLRGMFAFAIWDSKQKTLLLARDRLGKKPLYYFHSNDSIIFGSELKAILQSPDVPREVDLTALDAYLAHGYIHPPKTILKGVNKLAPGSYMLVSTSRRSIDIRRYWDLEFTPKTSLSKTEVMEQVRTTLNKAVELRMVSDVPLGVLLSGGIDSTIITGLMASLSSQPIKSFSIGFDTFGYNELPYARLVAERFKTDHHEFVVQPDIAQVVPEIVYYIDEPMNDSSVIPTYFVAKMAHEHVTVVLNGDGGDEAFSGYERYGEILSLLKFSKVIPWKMNDVLRSIVMSVPEDVDFYRFFAKARTFTEINHLSPAKFVMRSYQKWSYPERQFLYRPEVLQDLEALAPFPLEKSLLVDFEKFSYLSVIDQMLAIDSQRYLPDDLLVKMDRMCMANSLEARSPLLDQEMVELAASLPETFKRKANHGKLILRKTFSDLIPETILNRPKHGFSIPLEVWFRKELKEMLYDHLLVKNSRCHEFFEQKAIANILSEHQSGKDHSAKIWGLLVLELWQKQIIGK
jgi:asparagine synthase (glutamine-hydrolysing)